MLSRRDKLLVQPWEQRRFQDHRFKVATALPAVDDAAPAQRPHVARKLKKLQNEADRGAKIRSDNYSLLQRLGAIMRVNRLDNHWAKPLPNFSQEKVGRFYGPESLRSRLAARPLLAARDDPYSSVRCQACEARKRSGVSVKSSGLVMGLPPIF